MRRTAGLANLWRLLACRLSISKKRIVTTTDRLPSLYWQGGLFCLSHLTDGSWLVRIEAFGNRQVTGEELPCYNAYDW